MSKGDYDLDSSGGLMPLIQALIRPPDSRETSRLASKKQPHPYYRRPGRGHNRDCCDACQEGGDLICCDKCPASFHLGCHDPPLSEDDIPVGLWLCHTCRMTAGQTSKILPKLSSYSSSSNSIDNDGLHSEQNSDRSRSSTPAAIEPINAAKIRFHHKRSNSRCNSRQSMSSEHSATTEIREKPKIPLAEIVKNGNGESLINHSNEAEVKAEVSTNPEVPSNPQVEEDAGDLKKETEAQHSSEPVAQIETVEEPLLLPPPPQPTAMEELIRAAAILNPRQFELPRELSIFVKFPGDDKASVEPSKYSKKSNGKGYSNGNHKPVVKHELDAQGLVPLPAKTCFYCCKSCKKAPLIACDYCPLFFHQDCLDPPLTALPTGLWMCPNHPEQFIDWKLVSSISATERVKLWDQFGGPVDQETIKADFLRRVHRKNPPFRIKLKPKPRYCAEIPPMVEYHYKNPPPLLPSLRDVLRCEIGYKRGVPREVTNEDIFHQVDEDIKAFKEAKEKLKGFDFGTVDIKSEDESEVEGSTKMEGVETTESELPHVEIKDEEVEAKSDEIKASETKSEEIVSDELEMKEEVTESIETTDPNNSVSTNELPTNQRVENVHESKETKVNDTQEIVDLVPKDDQVHKIEESEKGPAPITNGHGPTRPPKRKRMTSSKSFGLDFLEDEELTCKFLASRENGVNGIVDSDKIDAELQHLDSQLIKQLAFQQLQQILSENPEIVNKYQTETANNAIKDALRIKPKKITLPSQMLSADDISRIAQEFLSPEKLGNKANQDQTDEEDTKYPVLPFIPPPADGILYTNGFDYTDNDIEMARAIAQRLERPLLDSKVRARAVLTPAGDILRGERLYTSAAFDDAIFMRYRSITIGSGPGCDFQFASARKCARLSQRHATIFFDEATQVYELLNYSEYGTEVNGQLFSCDFTEHPQLSEHRLADPHKLYKNIQQILDKKRGVTRIEYKIDENAVMAAPEPPHCECKSYAPLLKGWEGSAVLTHGSLIRFGCLAFVFSVVNQTVDEVTY